MLHYVNGSHVVDRSVALAAQIHTYRAAHAASCLPLTTAQATALGRDTRRRVPSGDTEGMRAVHAAQLASVSMRFFDGLPKGILQGRVKRDCADLDILVCRCLLLPVRSWAVVVPLARFVSRVSTDLRAQRVCDLGLVNRRGTSSRRGL